jgi:hypothetical protein
MFTISGCDGNILSDGAFRSDEVIAMNGFPNRAKDSKLHQLWWRFREPHKSKGSLAVGEILELPYLLNERRFKPFAIHHQVKIKNVVDNKGLERLDESCIDLDRAMTTHKDPLDAWSSVYRLPAASMRGVYKHDRRKQRHDPHRSVATMLDRRTKFWKKYFEALISEV